MADSVKDSSRENVEITCVIHHESARAMLISDDGYEDRAVWLPRSQISEINESGRTSRVVRRNGQMGVGRIVFITIPGWLARQQGLV